MRSSPRGTWSQIGSLRVRDDNNARKRPEQLVLAVVNLGTFPSRPATKANEKCQTLACSVELSIYPIRTKRCPWMSS